MNEISLRMATFFSYASEKLEWLTQDNAVMKESIAAFTNESGTVQALLAPQTPVEIAVPKRKPGRTSKAQIKEWERMYSDLTDLIWDFAVAKGYDTNNHKAFNCARTNIYQGHRRKTGYYPRKALNHPAFGSDSSTKLARCVFDGYGESLAEYIREEMAPSNVSPGITLRLNPAYAAH